MWYHEILPNIANVDSVRREIERIDVGAEKPCQITLIAPSFTKIFQIDGHDLLRRIVVEKAQKCNSFGDENRTESVRRRDSIRRPTETVRH